MTVSPRIAIDAMGGDIGPATIVAGMAVARIKNATLRFELYGDESLITGLAYHPSAPLLAAGTEGGRVLVWRATNGAEPAGVDVGGEVASIAWSPDGTRLAVGAADGGVGVIDVQLPAPGSGKAGKSR